MSGFSKGLTTTQKQLTSFQKNIGNSMKLIKTAVVGLAIGTLVKDSLTAASTLESAMMGLTSIVSGQGRDINKAKEFINDYVSDGLVPLTDAVTAYKNLVSRGYDDTQIENTMNRLKDAAAFGRQSSYSLGEAVKSATEGLRQENSLLVDNAGVTRNVAKMWEDYAKQIGKSTNDLTKQERIQAEVNGIMAETQFQVGDAAKYTQTYSGKLASLNKTLTDIKVNLGNAFMPIANVVVPTFQKLGNSLSTITASFASFSQAFFGKATVATVSNIDSSSEAVDGLTDSTNDATKAAKKAAASFDELNILGSGSSASASGSSSSSSSSPTVTTEEVTSTNSMAEAAENLKIKLEPLTKALGNLWEAVKPLGQTIGEGLVIFVDAFKKIGEKAITEWIPSGINALADAVEKIEPSDVTFVASALLSLATAILVYQGMTTAASTIKGVKGAFTGFLSSLAKHPIAAIASGIAALAVGVIAVTEAKFASSDIGKYIAKLNDLNEKAKTFNEETAEMIEKADERKEDIKDEYGGVQILADKYFALADKQKLSNKEQALLKTYADQLITKIPELSELINDQTGAYKGTKNEIQSLIDKTKEYYLVQAAQESLTEIATAQYEAQRLLSEQESERSVALGKLKTAQDELNKAVQESSVYGESAAETAQRVFEAHQKYDQTINELKTSLAEADIQINTTKETQKKLNTQWDYAVDYIQTYSTDAKTAMSKVEKSVKDAYSNIDKAAKNWKLPDLVAAVKVDTSALTNYINSQQKIGVPSSVSLGSSLKGYATGGFPSSGELFIGNENGIEMMGRMGSQNVVANNNQITEGIRQAVVGANSEEVALLKQQNSLLQAILEKTGLTTGTLYKAVVQENTAFVNRNGYSPITI